MAAIFQGKSVISIAATMRVGLIQVLDARSLGNEGWFQGTESSRSLWPASDRASARMCTATVRSNLSESYRLTDFLVIKRGARNFPRRARMSWFRRKARACNAWSVRSMLAKGGGVTGTLGPSV